MSICDCCGIEYTEEFDIYIDDSCYISLCKQCLNLISIDNIGIINDIVTHIRYVYSDKESLHYQSSQIGDRLSEYIKNNMCMPTSIEDIYEYSKSIYNDDIKELADRRASIQESEDFINKHRELLLTQIAITKLKITYVDSNYVNSFSLNDLMDIFKLSKYRITSYMKKKYNNGRLYGHRFTRDEVKEMMVEESNKRRTNV